MYDFYVPTRDDAPGVLDSQDTDPVHVAVEDLRRRTMWRSKRMITLAEGNVEANRGLLGAAVVGGGGGGGAGGRRRWR